MGMIETLEHPHLAPHALQVLVPLDFLLQKGPQCSLARDIPRRHLCGGTPYGHEGERGSGERVGSGGEGRCGWDSGTVTILGPTTNFPLVSTILFCALDHSFPTRSLTRRSDRYQIT